jgi:predicted HAD superfamily Cof-like phosphohydrolase
MSPKIESTADKLHIFNKAFQVPQNVDFNSEDESDKKVFELRTKLIREEYAEVMQALSAKSPDPSLILKELCDLVYVCVGLADVYNWNFDVAFNRVHASNMSKLDENGKFLRRDDGKVLKSDNYVAPDLKDLV